MGKPANDEFDAKVFLAKVGAGKTGISNFARTRTCSSKATSPTRSSIFKKVGSS